MRHYKSTDFCNTSLGKMRDFTERIESIWKKTQNIYYKKYKIKENTKTMKRTLKNK